MEMETFVSTSYDTATNATTCFFLPSAVKFLNGEKWKASSTSEPESEAAVPAGRRQTKASPCRYLPHAAGCGEALRLRVPPVSRAELTAILFTAQAKKSNHTLSG